MPVDNTQAVRDSNASVLQASNDSLIAINDQTKDSIKLNTETQVNEQKVNTLAQAAKSAKTNAGKFDFA